MKTHDTSRVRGWAVRAVGTALAVVVGCGTIGPSAAVGAAPSAALGAAPSAALGAAPSAALGAAPSAALGAAPSDVSAGAANTFTGVVPQRLMDTRQPLGATTFGPGGVALLPVRGVAGVPGDAVAVALNITVTNPSTTSFLTLWPSGSERPWSSNLNFTRAHTVANTAVVGVGSDGAIAVYNETGTVDVIIDVTGWFGAGFAPVTPVRVMDSRSGFGGPTLGPDQQQVLPLAGVAPPGAIGAALNVTATGPTATTFLTVWPGGQARPWSSNVNAGPRQTVANAAVVGLGGDQSLGLYNAAGQTDVVVDVMGWFVAGFSPVAPTRIMDTRVAQCGTVLDPTESRTVQVLGANGLPLSGVTGVALNVTAVGPETPTFLTVWPSGAMPGSSNLNAGPGEVVPNLVLTGISPTGTVELYNEAGPLHVAVDVTAFFTGDGPAGTAAGCTVRKPAPSQPPPADPPTTNPSGPTVTPGAFCSPQGATGRTVTGVLMLCTTSPTDTRARWRNA